MIGYLPESIILDDGEEFPINSDFRAVLTIFEAMDDPDLKDEEKVLVMLSVLFEDYTMIPNNRLSEACEKAGRFLDGGVTYKRGKDEKPIMNWKQDEQLIFSAINRVAGKEVRSVEYMHWWTFLGLMQEIDEKSLLSTVIQLRTKKNKGQKLEKWEQEFYKKHKDMVDIRRRYSAKEQAKRDEINRLLGSGI